jgi:hypothetical protein
VGAWLVDGEYVSQWMVSGGPGDERARGALQARFASEAALAAVAADLVAAGASPDAAVDEWLNLLKNTPSPYYGGESFRMIQHLVAASAVMCDELATRAYQGAASRPTTPVAKADVTEPPSVGHDEEA